ncbi:DeoR/GlpR family DNA-binding transcription regulator [Companilactobacillus nodensis]|uniref:DeoR family transcriptional regulator n=1 Tax=Companilactobacillus nodensis DSM 19682 = JCM 14932 = NBRC 107160 TaxID=1423775 RepID=A0A0R1KAV9_9LACO|nr:DeoR/GlpR family DNA-binding transcription regulator [Companilactobacillus nodensis]KRK80822.1 DeoR family transcriptional regulator [Companilactobacillus nodensis DSM 19682 = JCM 14932 = NBRC 107160]
MRNKRVEQMYNYIVQQKIVSLKELQSHFNVSMNTIRRDVAELEKSSDIQKVYGGVEVIQKDQSPMDELQLFNARKTKNIYIKKAIAQNASKLIKENDIIYIDSGTTTEQLLNFLPKDIKYVIVTDNFKIISQMEKFTNITLIVIGNVLDRETMSMVERVGVSSESLKDLNINTAFMAATGLSIKNGLTNYSSDKYKAKKQIVNNSQDIVVLADHTKIGKSTLMTYAGLNEISLLITDEELPEKYREYFDQNKINYHVVNKI